MGSAQPTKSDGIPACGIVVESDEQPYFLI